MATPEQIGEQQAKLLMRSANRFVATRVRGLPSERPQPALKGREEFIQRPAKTAEMVAVQEGRTDGRR